MIHILRLRYTGTEADAAPHVPGHVAYLARHHASGLFLASGQTVPPSAGGAILARGTRAEVEAATAEDPFVVEGVGAYEVTTVDVGRVAAGFEVLRDV